MPDDFIELFRQVSSDRVGLCLDVHHAFTNSREVFDDFIDVLDSRILHVHVADLGPAGGHVLPLGAGAVDLNHVIARLKELLTNPVIILELRSNEKVIDGFKKLKSLL